MEKDKLRKSNNPDDARVEETPAYERPKITTYTSKEILEEIGPAQACGSAVTCGIVG